jgi:hypothetical protein
VTLAWDPESPLPAASFSGSKGGAMLDPFGVVGFVHACGLAGYGMP